MFQKNGSSSIGGRKDAPLRKSDRRRLRDRAIDALFIGGGGAPGWIENAERLVDDAVVAKGGGDVLCRKLRLSGGEQATLFLRTPSEGSESSPSAAAIEGAQSLSYPASWPYRRTTQPILLEYEDADRKGHLVPLIPLLAALPPPPPLGKGRGDDDERRYRTPSVAVHPEVSKYICRGADLMRSGVRSLPPPWTLRQSKGLITISVIGNPQPVALGTVDGGMFREYCYPKNGSRGGGGAWREAAAALVGPGKKGVGVVIVSCYGDDLWRSALPPKSAALVGVANPLGGGLYDDGNFGNRGFVDGKYAYPILDVGGDRDEINDDDNEGEDESGAENAQEEGGGAATWEMARLNLSNDGRSPSAAPSPDGAPSQPGDNVGPEDENGDESVGDGPEPDHNAILERAFYSSLLLLLSSKTPLPMPVSTYYAKFLLSTVPSTGPRLDMKQTRKKKIGAFLLEMESQGVIRVGASNDGRDRCAFLAGITKNHPDLVQFKREWKKDIGNTGGGCGGGASQQTKKMAAVDLFIVPRHISDGLQLDKDAVMVADAKTKERRGTGFLTRAECRALLEGYIEREGLADTGGKGRVLLNGPLCDALYRVSKKSQKQQPGSREAEYPTSVKRKDLVEKWMERMDKGHAVVQMPGSKILHLGRGAPRTVDVEVEFRQGNRKKFLTRLRGMEEYGIDGASLSQDVSHRFACSSSIEKSPVGRPALKKGRVELVFQGHLSEELTALLTGDEALSSHGGVKGGSYNLPRSVINVVLRKSVPARKKR